MLILNFKQLNQPQVPGAGAPGHGAIPCTPDKNQTPHPDHNAPMDGAGAAQGQSQPCPSELAPKPHISVHTSPAWTEGTFPISLRAAGLAQALVP